MKHVERFLEEGSKVKLTIMFRGREMAHPELGRRILERVAEQVGELAIIESAPKPGRPQHDDGAEPDPAPEGQGPRRDEGCSRSPATRHQTAPKPTPKPAAAEPAKPKPPPEATAEPHTSPNARTDEETTMPKMKTHRGAAKRFKVTGTGKIRRRQANRAHLLEKKSTRRTRRLGRLAEVTGGDRKHVKRLLGR